LGENVIPNLEEEPDKKPFEITGYLRKILVYMVFSFGLFVLSVLLGAICFFLFPPVGVPIIEPIKEILKWIRTASPVELFILIFLNNSVKGLLNIILGPLLGIYPLLFILMNGFLVGYSFVQVSCLGGIETAILAIAPHGVIEIPATIACNAIGFKVALEALKTLFKKGNLRLEIVNGLKFFVRVILPLLLIAAFVEVFVTKPLIEKTTMR